MVEEDTADAAAEASPLPRYNPVLDALAEADADEPLPPAGGPGEELVSPDGASDGEVLLPPDGDPDGEGGAGGVGPVPELPACTVAAELAVEEPLPPAGDGGDDGAGGGDPELVTSTLAADAALAELVGVGVLVQPVAHCWSLRAEGPTWRKARFKSDNCSISCRITSLTPS